MAALAVISLLAVGACATGDADEPVGHASLALTATGPDGAIYRLPAGTVLRVSSGGYTDELSMDADEAVAHMTLPAGDYEATLHHPNGYVASWPLVRNPGPAESIADGELITPMPLFFTIEQGLTTELALLMRVTNVGDVIFANGELQASVTVETTIGDASTAGVVGHFQPDGQTFDDAWLALQDLFVFGDGASLPYLVDVRLQSAWWQASAARVCASVLAEWTSGEAHAGWEELMAELNGGVGALCIEGTFITLYVKRDGPSQSGLAPSLGSGDLSFSITIRGDLPTSPYDGTTLSLSSLNDYVALQGGFIDVGIRSIDGDTIIAQFSGGASALVRLFP